MSQSTPNKLTVTFFYDLNSFRKLHFALLVQLFHSSVWQMSDLVLAEVLHAAALCFLKPKTCGDF